MDLFDPQWWQENIAAQVAAVVAAPIPFAFLLFVACVLMFWLLRAHFHERMEALKATADHRQALLDDARSRLAALEASESSRPTPPMPTSISRDLQPAIETVADRHFRRQTVEIGGRMFLRCTFAEVTFIVDEREFAFQYCTFGPWSLDLRTPGTVALMQFLTACGVLSLPQLTEGGAKSLTPEEFRRATQNVLASDEKPRSVEAESSAPSQPETGPETSL